MTAELDDRHLGGVACSRRRLLEDQRHAVAVERSAELGGSRRASSRMASDLVGRQVGRSRAGGEWTPIAHPSTAADRHRLVDLVDRHRDRRGQADRGRRDRVDDEPVGRAARGTRRERRGRQLGGEQQPAAADLADARDRGQRRRRAGHRAWPPGAVRRCDASRRSPRSPPTWRWPSRCTCCRGRPVRTPRRPSSRAQQAPTGMPFPSALARVTTSGTTPSCWKPNHRPVRAEAGLDLVDDHQRPGAVAQVADRRQVAGWRRVTPPSPWIGSISTAPTVASTAAVERRRRRPTRRA